MIRDDCKHTEAFEQRHSETGDVIRKVDEHDCDYVDARNRLIPAAEKFATSKGALGRMHFDEAVFCAEMDRLAIEAGIMQPPGPWLARQKAAEAERRAKRQSERSGVFVRSA